MTDEPGPGNWCPWIWDPDPPEVENLSVEQHKARAQAAFELMRERKERELLQKLGKSTWPAVADDDFEPKPKR